MTYERAHSQYTDFRDVDRLARLRRMRGLARLMDTALRIPGTRFSFGADSIMGFVPVVGDFGGAAISLYIVNEARRLACRMTSFSRCWSISVSMRRPEAFRWSETCSTSTSNPTAVISTSFWNISVSTIPISIADRRRVNEPARSTAAEISSVELVNCGIVLDLTQPFIGCVSQIAVVGPAAEFDLGDQRRLRKDVMLTLERNGRRPRLQLVERLLQVGCVLFLETRADFADIDPIVSAPGGQQQAADPASGGGGVLVATIMKLSL